MTTYAYIRVSTEMQTVENQRFEIENYCKGRGISIDEWAADEGVSGGKDYHKRGIGAIVDKCGEGDLIICSEISRLGRDLMMVMEMLRRIMDKKCRLYTIKDNFTLGDDIQCKVLAFAFGLAAEIERKLIRQRTKEALARLKAQGVVLGRPPGRRKENWSRLSERKAEIIQMLNDGKRKADICRAVSCNRSTLLRFLKVEHLDEYVGKSVKKLEIDEHVLRKMANDGMCIASIARMLSISVKSVKKYADEYGIELGTKKSVYELLDEQREEIEERFASGESAQDVRKSLGIVNSTWCTWIHTRGLGRSYKTEELIARKKELLMLVKAGMAAKQIGEIMGFGTGCVCKALREMELDNGFDGVDYELAEANGIPRKAVKRRLSIGWSVRDAITVPLLQKRGENEHRLC